MRRVTTNLYKSIGTTFPIVQFGNKSFSATQIIDKILVARNNVAIKRYSSTLAPTVYVVKPGQTVGKVFSWVGPNENTGGKLYWMMDDANGRSYFVEHNPNWYNVSILTDQGAIDIKEQQQQREEADKSPVDKILETAERTSSNITKGSTALLFGVGTALAIWGLSKLIR